MGLVLGRMHIGMAARLLHGTCVAEDAGARNIVVFSRQGNNAGDERYLVCVCVCAAGAATPVLMCDALYSLFCTPCGSLQLFIIHNHN